MDTISSKLEFLETLSLSLTIAVTTKCVFSCFSCVFSNFYATIVRWKSFQSLSRSQNSDFNQRSYRKWRLLCDFGRFVMYITGQILADFVPDHQIDLRFLFFLLFSIILVAHSFHISHFGVFMCKTKIVKSKFLKKRWKTHFLVTRHTPLGNALARMNLQDSGGKI